MSTAPHEIPHENPPPPPPAQAASSTSPLDLLDRPRADRAREFRYRFAQSAVFGAPVVALQFLGPTLGGPTASLWIGLLQTLLAGWILYIAAAGLILEGLSHLLLRRRLTPDLIIALISTTLYLIGLYAYLRTLLQPTSSANLFFTFSTTLLCVWSLLRCISLGRGSRRAQKY